MLKNECFIIKEMSFLKINDPLKRDAIVKEYLELKNRIRGNLLSERIGESQLQTDLSKFYRPITETQKATTREITEGLKPISEGLENIRRDVQDIPGTISSEIAIKKYEKELEEEEKKKKDEEEDEEEDKLRAFGKNAFDYLYKKRSYQSDLPFGIHQGNDGFYYLGAEKIPNTPNTYNLNAKYKLNIAHDNIVVDNEKFIGTKGLWELIMKDIPDPSVYDFNDLENYKRLLKMTNVLHHNFDPNNPHPRSSVSYKWEKILGPIWEEIKKEKEAAKKTAEKEVKKTDGKGVVVIPSDPNALLERLDLLLASQEAGHTGVRNELVSICDELKRQGVLDMKAYKKLNHIIKK